MKHWFNNNYKTFIITAFLIPILTVAVVSISHVTQWYGISNPVTWSVYLSIGIEIAALSALAAISANMGSKVYFPFIVVTLIQFIGNIFFAYSYIDINSKSFKDWVDLVTPLVEFIGVEPGDVIGHKRFLALFAGGMLPIVSLSFLHMLVKFTEEDRKKDQKIIEEEERHLVDDKIIQEAIEKYKKEQEQMAIDPSEIARIRLSEEELKKLEETLLNPPLPNDAEKHKEQTEEDVIKEPENLKLYNEVFELDKDIEKPTEENEETIDDTIESLEFENSDISEDEIIPYDVAIDNEPEIEITNTRYNDFGSLPEIKEEPIEELIENTQFAPMDVVVDNSSITQEPIETSNINETPVIDNKSLTEKKKFLENQSQQEDHHLKTEDGQSLPLEDPQVLENDSNDLFWEQDESGPNQVIYDFENDQVIIPTSEDDITPTIRPKKVISRNVSTSQRRLFR